MQCNFEEEVMLYIHKYSKCWLKSVGHILIMKIVMQSLRPYMKYGSLSIGLRVRIACEKITWLVNIQYIEYCMHQPDGKFKVLSKHINC